MDYFLIWAIFSNDIGLDDMIYQDAQEVTGGNEHVIQFLEINIWLDMVFRFFNDPQMTHIHPLLLT